MKNEYQWNTTINGNSHTIFCKISNNRYILYVDDDYLMTIYRKMRQNKKGGIDEEIQICGQPCRFVVWEEIPDLVIDGRLVAKQMDYAQAKEKRKKAHVSYGIVQVVIALLMILVVGILLLGGIIRTKDANMWCALVVIAIGLVISGSRRIKRWREMK